MPLSPRLSARGRVKAPLVPELPVRLREFLRSLRSACKRAAAAEAVLRGVTSTRAPERLAAHLAELAGSWMGGHGWAVVSADEGRGVSWLADRGVSASRRPAVTAIAQLAMAQDQVTWTDEEAWPGTTRARSRFAALALPLRCRGKIVGVLVGIESRLPGGLPHIDLDEARLAPLHALLDGMAGALDTALHLKRAETLSTTDDLTGLFNSRFLAAALRRESEARRCGAGGRCRCCSWTSTASRGSTTATATCSAAGRWSRPRSGFGRARARPTSSRASAATSSR